MWAKFLGYSLICFFCCECLASCTTPPHIIVILADDLGFNDLSFRGSNLIPTPNIDALAYAGTILDRHYVLPSCTPSRSALLTGLHPIRLGTQGYPLKGGQRGGIPLGYKLMPEYLRDLGYRTHMVGKWHAGYETENHLPINRGFETFLGYYNGYIDFYQLDLNQTVSPGGPVFPGYDFHDNKGPRWDLQGQYATEIFTDAAVNIIKEHTNEEPLFLYISHLAAHTGTDAEGDGLQPPPGVNPDERFGYIDQKERRNFAAVVQSLDDSVGKIVSALNDADLLNNSVILFMADNGAPTVAEDTPPNYGSNWPLRGVKFTLYEGGVRGAAVIWSKLLPKSTINENFLHITDWLPTFVSIAGAGSNDSQQVFDGKDQWKSLQKGKTVNERSILLNLDEKESSEAVILDGRYKVVKQNMRRFGNCDYYYKVQMNSPQIPEITPENVISSLAGKALQDAGATYNSEEIIKQRVNAKVPCSPTEVLNLSGWVEPSTKFFCPDFCVFDLLQDPCELSPMDLPGKRDEGRRVLDYWRSRLVPQNEEPVDLGSDPRNFGGVWTPWLKLSKVNYLSESAATAIACTTTMVLIITGLLTKLGT